MRWSMPRNAKKRCVAVRGRAGGGRPSRRATERPDGRPGGRTTAWGPCNRAAGRPDDRAAGLPGGSAVGRPSGWAGGRAGERAGGRPGGRAAGQGQAAKRPSVAFDVSVTRFCSCVFFKWQWLVHKLVVTHWRGLKMCMFQMPVARAQTSRNALAGIKKATSNSTNIELNSGNDARLISECVHRRGQSRPGTWHATPC